jgi:hydroxymethylpyrimidine/phosphomethylpyrimidine kinase
MNPASERAFVISSLEAALEPLLKHPVSPLLIPPEGIPFGYAVRGARDSTGVAFVRIGTPQGCRATEPLCTVAFGMDEPVVRVILTVTKFNPAMRSAAMLPFSDRALAVLEEDLFLECASFSQSPARPGISTMDWGIAFCCKEDVPDVIYEKNPGEELSRLSILGEDPADVANNIIICSGRILNSEL